MSKQERYYFNYRNQGSIGLTPFEQVLKQVCLWRSRRKTIGQLRGLSDCQLRDMGIFRSQIPRAVRLNQVSAPVPSSGVCQLFVGSA